MECRIVRFGQRHNVAKDHPELAAARPDLVTPAFSENPVGSDDKFPYLFYLIEDGVILGSRKAIPDRVYSGPEGLPYAWCFDMYISSEARGKGLGHLLMQRMVEEFASRGTIVGGAFSVPAVMRLYQKLGYDVLGFTPKYARLRNVAPFLAKKIRSRFAVSLLAPIANAGLAAWSKLRSGDRNANITVQGVDPESLGTLSEEFDRGSQLYWDRESNWIISRLQPSDTLYCVREKSSKNPSAMLVARLRDQPSDGDLLPVKRLTIMHFVVDANVTGSCSHLAQAVCLLLRQTKADVADIVTSSPDLRTALNGRGFTQRGEGMTYVFKTPSGLNLPNADQQSAWHLTHFCSDGFTFD